MKIEIVKTADLYCRSTSELPHKEKNDCVVRALASSFAIDYDEAHKIARKIFNRQDCQGTFATSFRLNRIVKEGMEINNRSIELIWDNIDESIKQGGSFRNLTVGRFLNEHPMGTFLILVRGHAFTIKNGKVFGNWMDGRKLKVRITNAYKIVNKMKNVNVTVDSLQGMSSTQLRKTASKLGIKNYSRFTKSDLLQLCIAEIQPEKKQKTIDCFFGSLHAIADEELKTIVNSQNVSKSEKFRMLFKRGVTPAEVSKLFNAHYSFVYGVKQRMS